MTVVDVSPRAVVIVAAGEGTRLGYGLPKAFVPLAGRTLVQHAVASVDAAIEQYALVVVAPADLVERTHAMLDRPGVTVVAGGVSRQDSVRRGLLALPADTRTVLIHDAARALTPSALFDRVTAEVESSGAGVVPALPIADSIKRVAGGAVAETVDRSALAAVQTPQGFPFAQLRDAYAVVEGEFTDDTAVFAAAGGAVQVAAGETLAFKITTPDDLARAEDLLRGAIAIRTGIGIDVHAFGDSGELRLAGLSWPGVPALAGHSDGDAVAHAICDALLSAAGLGDIGGRFGTDDPRYAGAAGEVFLTATLALLAGEGLRPINVAVQLVGQRPRFWPRRHEAERALTELVGAPVSVAATTSDGLGFTGRNEGVAAVATALVGSIPRAAQ